MTRGERIRHAREKQGLTQTALADKINVSKQTMYKYEMNIVTNIPADKVEAIALACGCTPEYIMGWEDSPADSLPDKYGFKPVKTITLPLYKIACGEPKFMADLDLTIDVDADIDADYCLEAVGDSMINARIYPGDIIFIKKCDMVDNGEIAVVAIGDEATLKRVYYYREDNLLRLVPENPMYKPLVYSGAELDQVRILGKVVRVQFNL